MPKKIRLALLSACLFLSPLGSHAVHLTGIFLVAICLMAAAPASAQTGDETPPAPAATAAPAEEGGHAPAAAHDAAPAGEHAAPAHGGNPWTPQTALDSLKEGNARFVSKGPAYPEAEAGKALRHKLATEGQTPKAAILSCSDSRAPVEAVFDQDFGDVFSIRAAGAVPGVDQLGSLEYAVAHLGVPLVVVLSHTKCGAVTAAVTGANEPGNLGALLHKLDPIAQEVSSLADSEKIERAVAISAQRFSQELSRLSPIIKTALDEGKIQVVNGVYDIDTGEVRFQP
jgi:carbonic anhydrase